MARTTARTVWFHRGIAALTGGQVKHGHYFDHVRTMPGFSRKLTFSKPPPNEARARERQALWPAEDGSLVARWIPVSGDVLFLEGVDWLYLAENGLLALANPRINLVQGVRHADESLAPNLYRYLAERAVRICVSQEVADAISATGRPKGPILTIPNGIDIALFEADEEGSPAGYETRRQSITIVGYKSPDLARGLSERLDAECIEHLLVMKFLDRSAFLDLLAESRVAVCLPYAVEGFYLPAIEAMASGSVVVTLDCVGNRSFCLHAENCLVAEPGPESLLRMTKRALAMPAPERGLLHQRARDTAVRHSLEAERERFHAVLTDIDYLWRMA